MNPHFPDSVAGQLEADFRQEKQLVDLIIQGYIEYRWAIGEEEREIAEAIMYNAFETYAVERGMSLQQAEIFCEHNLKKLIQAVYASL